MVVPNEMNITKTGFGLEKLKITVKSSIEELLHANAVKKERQK